MMRLISRSLRTACMLLLVTATFAAMMASSLPTASAQIAVVGTADFRNAPVLPPGTYSDRIVSGDSAWYALVYTNDTPYRFEVSLRGTSPSELDLTATFVAPTLGPVGDSGAIVEGPGARYPSGDVNIWFLRVTLDTTGDAGVEYPVQITVEGVESTGFDNCETDATCTFDDQLAVLNDQVATNQAALDEALATEREQEVRDEIENLQSFGDSAETLLPRSQARLAAAEAEMARLCAPEAECETFPDPGTTTPMLGWAVGGFCLIGGAYAATKKLQAEPVEEEPKKKKKPAPPRRPRK